MRKENLLKHIADTGYNVGFGAKKHFATYDITDKVPAMIGFVSIAIGILALFIDWLAAKHFAAAFIILGVLGISISLYDQRKESYADAGRKLTKLFNRLKHLYFSVKAASDSELPEFERELKVIEDDYSQIGMTDQILFSGWFAHYKFFWELQIDWIDEQKHFKFFRDKLPLSFMLTAGLILVVGLIAIVACLIKS